MLSVDGIHTFYGPIEALRGISIEVRQGEMVTLIGANGAGKSTLLMTICGNPHAARGKIAFDGADITRRETHEIVGLGNRGQIAIFDIENLARDRHGLARSARNIAQVEEYDHRASIGHILAARTGFR